MRGENSMVVCGRKDPSTAWDQLDREGGLARIRGSRHVVLQVAQANRTPLVLATARSLLARLTVEKRHVVIVDAGASPTEWEGFVVRTLRSEKTLRVAALAVPHGLVVPQLWCEPFTLLTVTGVGPSPTSRVASILEAQAESLTQLGNDAVPRALIYEAHRLAPSDLAIVAGCDAAKEPFWAASASDVALEQAVLHAAGVSPTSAPHFRELLRHEIPPPPPHVDGVLPSLGYLAAPEWQVRRATLRSSIRASSHVFVHDFRNLRGNLHKIPAFVRRRVATWRAQRGGA